MGWRERININPKVCGGKAYIKGTRVDGARHPGQLAEGESYESIMQGYHLSTKIFRPRSPSPPIWPRTGMFLWTQECRMLFKLDENLRGKSA